MRSPKEGPLAVLRVALLVSLVSSVVVAATAVGLQPMQQENRRLDREHQLLAIVGLDDGLLSAEQTSAVFEERMTPRLVDLETGEYLDAPPGQASFDPLTWDGAQAAINPDWSRALERDEDIAGLQRRERYAVVYKLMDGDKIEALILPVRGYGLWSTLYGFLAIEGDLNTVRGLRFYEHKETPGLGGEVDNPRWRAQWRGKSLFGDDEGGDRGAVKLRISKAGAGDEGENSRWQVDALAGATLTTNGVNDMIRFWLGPLGFGPYLDRLRKEGGAS